jgi:hypothetical protein
MLRGYVNPTYCLVVIVFDPQADSFPTNEEVGDTNQNGNAQRETEEQKGIPQHQHCPPTQ